MKRGKLDRAIAKFVLWHKLVRSWNMLQFTVFVGLTVLALYILVDRLVYLHMDYGMIGLAIGMVGSLVILVGFLAMTSRETVVSYLVDRNAGLKNLISSGLEAQDSAEPVCQAVVARAESEIQKQNMKKSLPMKLRWPGKCSVLPLIFAGGFMFIPYQDLLQRKQTHDEEVKQAKRLTNSAKLIEKTNTKLIERSKNLKSIDGKNLADDLKQLEKDLKTAESTKEALAKLNSLESRYNKERKELRDFEKATRNLTARMNAKDLNKMSSDELKRLARNLRKGDLANSAENMRKLAQQMLSKDLSDEEKQALARELSKLMDQYKGDSNADELAKELKKMQKNSANAAKNQTAPNNKNQSANASQPPTQNQQSNQKNKAQKNQQQAANQKQGKQPGQQPGQSSAQNQGNVADKMNEMAENMDQMDTMRQMQEGLDKAREEMLGKEFKGFDAKDVEEYLENESQASLGEKKHGAGCPGGNCQGGSQCPGNGGGKGGAFKRPGRGNGGKAPEQMTQTGTEDKLSKSKIAKGQILNQRWIYGVPEKGEAQREYTNDVRSARDDAMTSLAKNRIPREYEERVKKYFSSLSPKGEEKGKEKKE